MSAPAHATPHHPAPHAGDTHTDAHADAHADAAFYRQALHGLVGMGTGFARLLHDTAQAGAAPAAAATPPAAPQAAGAPPAAAPPAPAPHAVAADPATLASLAGAFAQAARAVRRCIMLAQTLNQPAKPAPDPTGHRVAARKRILRETEDSIGRGYNPDSDAAEALRAELHERLDAPDLDADILTRPVADIITEIRRDLGLDANPGTRPFQRRTPADVALLNARAAAPCGIRQPGPAPQTSAPTPQASKPQTPGHGAAQPTPDPECRDGPSRPAAARLQPGPTHPGSALPDDPAEAVALILRRHAGSAPRWRPPPGG